MDPRHCRAEITDLLDRLLAGTRELGEILVSEHAALCARSLEGIGALIERKKARMEDLQNLDLQRQALVQSAGFAPDEAGMQACLHWCDTGGTLLQRWQDLLTEVAECQRQNQINGAAIELSRTQVQRALAVLRGQTGEQLYDPNGSPDGGSPTRHSLAKA